MRENAVSFIMYSSTHLKVSDNFADGVASVPLDCDVPDKVGADADQAYQQVYTQTRCTRIRISELINE